MKYDLFKKYGKKYIFLTNIKTYPKRWLKFLYKNKKFFCIYFDKNIGIHNEKVINKYLKIVNNFFKILFHTHKEIVFYHVTRLIEKEISQIKKDGLKCFDKIRLCNEKLSILLDEKLINVEEYNILKDRNLLNDEHQRRENKIYLISNPCDEEGNINDTLQDLHENYGGEIIYNAPISDQICKKLKENSFPLLILVNIKLKDLENNYLAEEIIKSYINDEISDMENTVTLKKDVKNIIDIIPIDKDMVIIKE